MEAIEAPEKIYVPMSRYWYGIDSLFYPVRQHKNDTEYIRTDAFIEKAIKYVANHFLVSGMDNEIKDFVNYMKGE